MSDKPEIDFPERPAARRAQIIDLTEGDGAEAAPGDTAVVHYVGVAYSTGEEFDASWNRGEPSRSRSAPATSSPAGTGASSA